MGAARVFRLIESSLVVLFFIQAIRVVFAILLSMAGGALAARQVDLVIVNSHLALIVALVLPWFSPRTRAALPRTLMISAILVAVARLLISLNLSFLRLYAGVALVGFAGVYFASLLRANWRAWISSIVVGITIDQLLRALDTYDLSLRVIMLEIPMGTRTLGIPWLGVQVFLSAVAILASLAARRSTRQEPYEPAFLTVWGGLAIGGFWVVETLLLSMPGVIARWTGVSYAGLVPWLILVTALPLLPSVRKLIGHTLGLFDAHLRGWVWMFVLLLTIILGNRLGGPAAAGILIVAQFVAVLSLWWIPSASEITEIEQVGPSFSLGMFVLALLVYAYSLTFEYARTFLWLKDQGLIIIVVAVVLLTFPRLWWHEEDLWEAPVVVPKGVPITFVVPMAVFGLMLSGLGSSPTMTTGNTLRVATYNINEGYDAGQNFRLELIARTIEAGLADVVVLQEVDAGRPVGYGVDQVQFLARRLRMYQYFQPTVEGLSGIAILSKWPIGEQHQTLLPGPGIQKGAFRVLVGDPATGRYVTVLGTQLSPGQEEDRLQQLAVLLNLALDSQAGPVVLAADLGASPDDVVYQQLLANGFVDPNITLGIEQGFTAPSRNPTLRHDYVLVRGLIPIDSRQVDSAASDHRLVVVEVGWP
ncbi:MAG: endonuclease/exonuclease/phosphatase family protein [Anaerolineae bacterium]|nr:endonuclease/exonuclease/phosphatase family protein [Anaerolineae bacterium]